MKFQMKRSTEERGAAEGIVLKAVESDSDAFPPLRYIAGCALYICETIKDSKSIEKEWLEFAYYVQESISSVLRQVPGVKYRNHLRKNVERLRRTLEEVCSQVDTAVITAAQRLGQGSPVRSPEEIQGMKEELDTALNVFHTPSLHAVEIDVVPHTLQAVDAHNETLQHTNNNSRALHCLPRIRLRPTQIVSAFWMKTTVLGPWDWHGVVFNGLRDMIMCSSMTVKSSLAVSALLRLLFERLPLEQDNRDISYLPDETLRVLRHNLRLGVILLLDHLKTLSSRPRLESRRERERQREVVQRHATHSSTLSPLFASISSLGEISDTRLAARHFVLPDNETSTDHTPPFPATSVSNIPFRWQKGRLIGAGAFGSVYLAVNLDSDSLMAVKEIKLQDSAGLSDFHSQIRDELSAMEILHHTNVVEYYGIEVHPDRVYIFEEYCQGGSLGALLEHGRIEDEAIIQVYAMQMLEGLHYLHLRGVEHRDIKPDNVLLDHLGVIKLVDFGAAKILAKNQRSAQGARRNEAPAASSTHSSSYFTSKNELSGTPMYMSPEIIKNDNSGRHGAMDIWSLGCIVLELATGKKPWSNLDNEWAIMFQIGAATQHPPLPEPGQLSVLGIDFIQKCLTVDVIQRPTASELMDHPWMVEFRETLLSYEQAETTDLASDEGFESAAGPH